MNLVDFSRRRVAFGKVDPRHLETVWPFRQAGIRGLARTGVTTRRPKVRRRRGRPYRGFCR